MTYVLEIHDVSIYIYIRKFELIYIHDQSYFYQGQVSLVFKCGYDATTTSKDFWWIE